MGSALDISCDSCRFTTTKTVGVGFIGIKHVIAVCRPCKKMVGREYSVFEHSQPPDFPCKNCGKPFEIIYPQKDEDQDSFDGVDLGTCVKCEGRLTGEFSGLMWD